MTSIAETVEIAARLEQVFAFASGWRIWEQWWVGASRFRPTTAIARGNGARYADQARSPSAR